MSAEELRRYITLVESATAPVAEAGISRRGLFKSAAAIAAVAALPAPVKKQAVELIKSKGVELVQAAQAIQDADLEDWTTEQLGAIFNQTHETYMLDSDFMSEDHHGEIRAALAELTGIPLQDGNGTEEFIEQMQALLDSMSPERRLKLFNDAYVKVGLGPEWPAHKLYRIFKRFPKTLDIRNIKRSLTAVDSLLPGQANMGRTWDYYGDYDHGEYLAREAEEIRYALEVARDRLGNQPRAATIPSTPPYRLNLDAWSLQKTPVGNTVSQSAMDELDAQELADFVAYYEHDLAKIEDLIRQYKEAGVSRSQSHPAASTSGHAPQPPATRSGQTSQPPGNAWSLLRAAIKIINAFSNKDRITDNALDVLKDIKPEDIKLTMQRDAGQEPAEPQQPAALPAPEPRIDLGLDPTRTPDRQAIRRDET